MFLSVTLLRDILFKDTTQECHWQKHLAAKMGTLNYLYWSYENRVSKHFVIFLNFSWLKVCLLCCLLMCFFACFVVRDLCRSGFRQNYYLTPLPPSLPPSQFFFVPTHNSLFNRVFSHDVTAAILVSQNNETAAMLVSQTNPVGVELFSYGNAFFCSNKFA